MPRHAGPSAGAVDLSVRRRLSGRIFLARAFRKTAEESLNMVLPPHCGACDAPVDMPGRLCAECWNETGFNVPPYCAGCGLPFEIEAERRTLYGDCLRQAPACRRARVALFYRAIGRDLVLALKMADRTWIAPDLAGWMANAGAELLPDADLIAPVPLHR